jgi:hypothetical protein
MSPAKRRVSLRVDPVRLRALQTMSARTGAPVAELMRRAISDYVARHFAGHEQRMIEEEEPRKNET